MKSFKSTASQYSKKSYSIPLVVGAVLASGQSHAIDNVVEVQTTALSVCQSGSAAGTEFQDRCNAVFGDTSLSPGGLSSIMTQVTSEQTAAQKSMSLEMNGNHLGTLTNRISALRSGRQSGGLKISGLMLDQNGNPMSSSQLAQMNNNFNKAAAGDELFDRLGIFINGNIGFGDRRTTANEAGYDLDTHGTTVGADYRFTDNFLMGMAFSYNNAHSGYANNLGEMEADNYSGAIYGSFFTEDGFFVDGLFSGSHIDYESRRRIAYTVASETINTNAFGENSGDEFNVAMTSGYNFNYGGLLVTPQIRVDYTTNQVDALNETGGQGWALQVNDQDFDSLQTAAGLQLAYSISTPWAVLIPTVKAEYIHEFKNDARSINANFIQDSSNSSFIIVTDRPDRDYIVMNAGVSAQFAHGISAFVNYDTVQAHSYVNNHNFTGGVRMELTF